ncbi:hypothetical protein TNCV_3518471 [Trichonephila clavipes]|uniref:Uncharacterized protein n=1 Tax=Trichonephila clavipes TaxID=2585209 RepID=A0A8X6SPC9_TRICX|nr:hypothetical protein TNCV_3518471 [Trichonephila clavipes]
MIESTSNSNEFRSYDGSAVRILDADFNIVPWSVTKNTTPCSTRIRTTTICVNNQGLIGLTPEKSSSKVRLRSRNEWLPVTSVPATPFTAIIQRLFTQAVAPLSPSFKGHPVPISWSLRCAASTTSIKCLRRRKKKTDEEGECKEQLPAPGNRSNERRDREKDLATTGEKKVGTGEKKGRGRKKPGWIIKRHDSRCAFRFPSIKLVDAVLDDASHRSQSHCSQRVINQNSDSVRW